MHGKVDEIRHKGTDVFQGLSNPLVATRYHSLIVDAETLPDTLEVTAQTADGLIMGLVHKELPIHGVQFHPESIATAAGHDLLANFIELAEKLAVVIEMIKRNAPEIEVIRQNAIYCRISRF